MNKTVLIAALTLLMILAACGSPPAATDSPPTQPAADSPTEAVTQPTDTPSPVEESNPTEEASTEGNASAQVSFSNDIMPIFENRCIECHGGRRTREGLDMKTYENLLRGSNNGPVVMPGDAGVSLFVELIVKGDMPNRGPKVTPDELQLIIDWVNQGALNN